MSYHIVSIDAPDCSLSCKDGQLTCKSNEGERRLPLEDVGAIVVTSFSASIHSKLLLEAAKHGVGLVICENFKPASLVLPANRATDTLLTRAQAYIPAQLRDRLWRKTIDAKCRNQLSLAREIAPEDPRLARFEMLAKGRAKTKEAECAKVFWRIAPSVFESRQSPSLVMMLGGTRVAPSVFESRQSGAEDGGAGRGRVAPSVFESRQSSPE
ncbi:CRISPR-associated endonuclease Cas1 [Haloferula sp. A504]|uniref:CRISPR-associated endonuclease Cas1 n=1 Tax=Haloferula sp. A504 TaxID=3373601 RepID=UPI0031C31472|nr:CRISPR-associated endonuclease Cas1 [Verrucomicrobiaceae bacterium E54]